MISSSIHTLNPAMTQSLNHYRQSLSVPAKAAHATQAVKPVTQPASPPVSNNPLPETPIEPDEPIANEPYVPPEPEPELNQYSQKDLMQQAAAERRDAAREAAVHVGGLQHQQKMVDVYINALPDSESSSSSTSGVTPASAYEKTLTYGRQSDFMAALQKAKDNDFGIKGQSIDIVV